MKLLKDKEAPSHYELIKFNIVELIISSNHSVIENSIISKESYSNYKTYISKGMWQTLFLSSKHVLSHPNWGLWNNPEYLVLPIKVPKNHNL